MGLLGNKTPTLITFNGKRYSLNLEKLKSVCLTSSSEGGSKEYEIIQTYDSSESGELSLGQKVEHETRVVGNGQNDMIVYDIVKLMLISLLEDNRNNDEFEYTFGTALSINTLISWGILEEL